MKNWLSHALQLSFSPSRMGWYFGSLPLPRKLVVLNTAYSCGLEEVFWPS